MCWVCIGDRIWYTTTAGEKFATDTLTPFPASVVYNMSGPMGGGLLYTGAEAEKSAVNFQKQQCYHCIKVGIPV